MRLQRTLTEPVVTSLDQKAMTCRLEEVRPYASSALAAPMAQVMALTAPAALALSGAPFHEPFHAEAVRSQQLVTVCNLHRHTALPFMPVKRCELPARTRRGSHRRAVPDRDAGDDRDTDPRRPHRHCLPLLSQREGGLGSERGLATPSPDTTRRVTLSPVGIDHAR
jgi:hypothetical protein